MRLNPFEPGSINVRRGGGGGFPGGGGGQIGCGTLVIALIAVFVFGVDPTQMLGSMDDLQRGQPAQEQIPGGETAAEICDDNAYATESCNALGSLDQVWAPILADAGVAFRKPYLAFYSGGTGSACGSATSAVGPFYCPGDESIYIDTSFYDQMARELGAEGDFARYYVMAHEYGHHVQTLTGVARQIRSAQQQSPSQANALQVLLELQADCYAGVWAGRNRNLIEPGDFEEGMTAASAIGDDTLMRRSGRAVDAESFTHGSSAQRMQALRLGLESGDVTQCDRIVELR